MLPKSQRLKDKYLFNLAFKKKQVIRSKILSLYFLYDKKELDLLKKDSIPRCGFIVGKSVDKRATARNLIKRRMRNVHKEINKNIYYIDNRNKKKYFVSIFIWIANPGILNATFSEIKDTMNNLVNKIELTRFIKINN